MSCLEKIKVGLPASVPVCLLLLERQSETFFVIIIMLCHKDHELVIAKIRLKLKKVGKTTRLFRYDLNQIPYGYTVEVTSRFKGLDPIDRVPDELWTEVHEIVQEAGRDHDHLQEKEMQKGKMVV